uniref:Syntaxin-6_N domain-containing protein n=1 Tax=Macrostomum lignano TaxID=282301 RepID=A0A1I8HUT2_9PLAT
MRCAAEAGNESKSSSCSSSHMTDPFMLDQREAAASFERLLATAETWRNLRCTRDSGGQWTEAMEFELQELEGAVKNGIRSVKWSLDELSETLQLLKRHADSGNTDGDPDSLKSRQNFLETSRIALSKLENEFCLPPAINGSDSQEDEDLEAAQSMQLLRQQRRQSKKSVSWQRHTRASDGEIRQLDECSSPAKSGRRKICAAICQYRLWISVALVVALLLMV